MKVNKNIFTVLMVMATVSAQAAEKPFFRPFIGLDLGLSNLGAQDAGESNKSGSNFGFKGVGNFNLSPKWSLDVGLGWQHNQITTNDNSTTRYKITTKSLFTEIGAQYDLNQNWSVGVVDAAFFGTDMSYSQTVGENDLSNFIGPKVMFETKVSEEFPLRVEGSWKTSLDLNDRRSNLFTVGVQIGWEKTKKVAVAPAPVKQPVIDSWTEVGDTKLVLAKVSFSTDSFDLSSKTQTVVAKIARFLAQNPNAWGRVKISGHADLRGEKGYNKNLSQDRADSVYRVLAEGGVPESKIQARGFGISRPLNPANTPEAWTENRRVEIEFFEVQNRKEFNKALAEIIK